MQSFYPDQEHLAQELMRHSDRRLTDQVYLDTNLLPLQERMRNISQDDPLTNILTNISGKMGRNGSRVGEIEPLEKAAQTALNAAFILGFWQSEDSENLVEVAGIEPARAGDPISVNKRDSAHSRD